MRSGRLGGLAAVLAASLIAIPDGFGQQRGLQMVAGSGVRRVNRPKKDPKKGSERILKAEAKRERKNAKRLRDFKRSEQGRSMLGVSA